MISAEIERWAGIDVRKERLAVHIMVGPLAGEPRCEFRELGTLTAELQRLVRVKSTAKAEEQWLKVFRTLNEFQARLFAADKALDLGRGGIRRLAR